MTLHVAVPLSRKMTVCQLYQAWMSCIQEAQLFIVGGLHGMIYMSKSCQQVHNCTKVTVIKASST